MNLGDKKIRTIVAALYNAACHKDGLVDVYRHVVSDDGVAQRAEFERQAAEYRALREWLLKKRAKNLGQ